MSTDDTESSDPSTSATLAISSVLARPSEAGSYLARFTPGAVLVERYELVCELGAGAHGAVWKALDRHVDEFVALKVLRYVRENDLLLLRRELSAARRVTHPGVVRMHDLVDVGGAWALSMEFVDGESLERLIERGAEQGGLEKERVHQLAVLLAEALAAAHDAAVTHRDLKPANILVRKDGRPVITDFGISRVTRRESVALEGAPTAGRGRSVRLTVEGEILGTPLYMAPEQLEARADVTPSVDLYAWALIVHELATARVPHEAETLQAVKERRLSEPVPPLDESVASPRLRNAVERCLSRDPSLRPRDGAALVGLLAPAAPIASLRSPPRRHPLARLMPALLVVAVVGAVAAIAFAVARRPPQPAAEPVVATQEGVVVEAKALRVPTFRNARKLTFGPTCEEYSSFSPDGKYVLFDKSEGARSHLFRLELASGREERLTTSPRWDYSASYAPDGRSIVFLRQAQQPTATLLELATGKLREVAVGAVRPTFGLDGRSVWAGDPTSPGRFDLESGAVLERLVSPTGMQALRFRTLVSGQTVGVFRVGDSDASLVAAYEEGAWKTLHTGRFYDTLTLSADQTTAYFFSEKGALDRRVMAYRPGTPEIVEREMLAHADLAISPDEASAVWSTCRNQTAWAVLEGRVLRAPSEDPSSSEQDVALLDDRTIVISARDGTDNKLWMTTPGSPPSELRAVEGIPVELHADGRAAIVATQRGLYRVDFSTGSAVVVQLTSNQADVAPSTDSQGNVVFARQMEGGSRILSVPREGGVEATVRWSGEARWPAASPTGAAIVFVDQAGALMKLSGGVALPFGKDLPAGPYERPMFSLDGRRVAVVRELHEVLILDAASGRVLERHDAEEHALHQAFFDRTGALHVIWSKWDGDLWRADVVFE